MRRANDVWIPEQLIVGARRLAIENIKRGADDLPLLERLAQGLIVDQRTAPGVAASISMLS